VILVVGPSPSYQRVWTFEHFKLDHVNRAQIVEALPSGKGVNCARAARRLGSKAEILTFLGGETGEWVQQKLHEEDLPAHVIRTAVPTRSCHTLIDRLSGFVTELVEEPCSVASTDEQKYRTKFEELLSRSDLLVCIGSIPRGMSQTLYRDFIRLANKRGIPAILDAQNDALISALEMKPAVVKVNHRELAEALKAKLSPEQGIQEMLKHGCGSVLVTCGSEPAWLGWDEKIMSISLPGMVSGNATGSGDSVCAGLAIALLGKRSMADAARYALGCGIANVGFGYGRLSDDSARHWTKNIERLSDL